MLVRLCGVKLSRTGFFGCGCFLGKENAIKLQIRVDAASGGSVLCDFFAAHRFSNLGLDIIGRR